MAEVEDIEPEEEKSGGGMLKIILVVLLVLLVGVGSVLGTLFSSGFLKINQRASKPKKRSLLLKKK